MLSRETIGKFLESTPETPTFASVDLYDTLYEDRDTAELPYLRADVAVYSCKQDLNDGHVYARMAVLDAQHIGESDIYRSVEFGDYITRDISDIDGHVLKPTKELMQKYQDFLDLHENSPYVARGRLYGPYVVPEGMNIIHGHADVIPGTEAEFDLEGALLNNGRPVKSLNDACQWVLENQRAYIQGIAISQHVAGDVSKPVPSSNPFITEAPHPNSSYPIGTYENAANRLKYADIQADNFETKAGGPTAEEIIRDLRLKERELPSVDKSTTASYDKQPDVG